LDNLYTLSGVTSESEERSRRAIFDTNIKYLEILSFDSPALACGASVAQDADRRKP